MIKKIATSCLLITAILIACDKDEALTVNDYQTAIIGKWQITDCTFYDLNGELIDDQNKTPEISTKTIYEFTTDLAVKCYENINSQEPFETFEYHFISDTLVYTINLDDDLLSTKVSWKQVVKFSNKNEFITLSSDLNNGTNFKTNYTYSRIK